MKGFLLMVSFFTRIPIGKFVPYSDETYQKGLMTFPFVGMVIGFFLAILFEIPKLSEMHRAILVILVYLMMSGGIHLDGLADSADGLLSGRSKVRMLEIMKDSRIGSFGVIALILYFLVFYAGVQSVTVQWVFLMPFIGKALGYTVAGFSNYAREEQGMGYVFMSHIKPRHAVFMMSIAALITYGLLGVNGLVGLAVALGMTTWIAMGVNRKINGQTGDTIGMIIEIGQMVFLFVGSMI